MDPAAVEAAAGRDHRSPEQRNHDALKAVLLWVLDSGKLGQHNGFPMHVILTMTLQDLEEQTGVATTATGGLIPVPEVLTMAARTRLYLTVFDLDGRPTALLPPATPHREPGSAFGVVRFRAGVLTPGLHRARDADASPPPQP